MTDDLTQCRLGDSILMDITTICGVRLRPFCLGHIILLESLGNPLISPTEMDITLSEGAANFIIALLVCAMTYEDGIEFLTNDKILGKILINFCDNLSKNIEADKNWNLFDKLNLFQKYMATHLDMPFYETITKSATSSPSGSDWKSSIFTIFKKNGYTESEILNMNLKKLFLTWVSFAEEAGTVKMLNKYEADTIHKFGSKK